MRGQEARARPLFDVGPAPPLHDHALDARREQQIAEHETGRPRPDDHHGRALPAVHARPPVLRRRTFPPALLTSYQVPPGIR
ncbi:hypothetical protein KNE206_06000 [Kitasatospora sp. NE20-6]